MLSEPTYLAARMVAPQLEAHFMERHAEDLAAGVFLPPAALVEVLIDVAFWASLRQEEGHPPKISLALLPPGPVAQPLLLGKPRRLTAYNLLKLAPAVEQPGIHLGVWHDADGLYVWGTATSLPPLCLVLEVVEPGLLVAKHSRAEGFGKFINLAILRGDQLQLVDVEHTMADDYPALRPFLPGNGHPTDPNEPDSVLVELAAAMRAHGRGGLVLMVPPHSTAWQASIVQPITYPIEPPYTGIAQAQQQDAGHWQDDYRRAIGIVGGFTAVDGATVITRDYHMLAFGVKVTRAATSVPVEQLMLTEPVIGSETQYLHPAQNGGTRHLAAAQFVHDQHDALALVASQDGFFTVFAWSAARQMVHAHRIDVLLL